MSTALCLCLIFGLTPGAAMGAEDEPGEPPALTEAEARYQKVKNGEWFYGSLEDACAESYEYGTVALLRDVEQTEGLTISKALFMTSAGEAPHKITYSSESRESGSLLTIRASVILENIILDGGRETGRTSHTELVTVQTGALNMGQGAVIQNNDNVDDSESAGGLRVVSGQAVLQTGSAIRSCRGRFGGGAAVASRSGMLVLNGGSIENCQAVKGGGICIQGVGNFRMFQGSLICGNSAEGGEERCGGGVYVEEGILQLPGGEIRDNSAQYGGGMYLESGQVQIGNLSVTGNCADVYAGGIFASPLAAVGIGSPGTEVNPNVTGNLGGEGYFDNIYLDGSSGDPVASGEYIPTQPMAIIFDLGDSASIGISRWVRPDKESPSRIIAKPANRHMITEFDLSKFHSDDPSYVTLLKDGNIVLTSADVVFDTKGHGETPPGQQIDDNHVIDKPMDPEATGYTFGGWYDNENCEGNEWNFDTEITMVDDALKPIKTLYAKWTPTPYSISYELEDGENAGENPESYNIETSTITLQTPTKEGHTFLGWTWEGHETPEKEVTIPQGSTEDKTFTANWEKKEEPAPVPPVWDPVYYTITASAGEGGSIEPEGRISVPLGGSRSFSVTPDEGWEIADVLVDDKSVGAVTGYSFETVTSSHTIEARFRRAGGFGYADCPRDHTCPIWPYTDASTTDWYHDGVHFCIENGLMVGYGNKIFAPCDCLSRGMLAQIIYNRAGRDDIAVNFIVLPEFFSDTLSVIGQEATLLRQFLLDCLFRQNIGPSCLHFRVADDRPIQNLAENLLITLLHDTPNRRKVSQMTMTLLFLQLLSHTDKLDWDEQEDTILKLLRYVEDHYTQASLTEAAQLLHTDVYSLSRLIRRQTGKTFTQLVQEKRLAQAAFFLKSTGQNVDDIALAVGYENISYFHRIFKAAYGLSPRQYRLAK